MKINAYVRVACACAALWTVVGATGCGGSGGGAPSLDRNEIVYRGRYTEGFEVNGFTPCGSTENWWAVGIPQGLPEDYRTYTPIYVEVKGTLSEPGQYGHVGAYSRQLEAREVTVRSREIPDTCQ